VFPLYGLQVLVMVLAAVLLLTWLARRLRVSSPIVLLLGEVTLAFVPWANGVPLPPSVVLLIFLPALLYWESLTMSLREIRANLRIVLADTKMMRGVTPPSSTTPPRGRWSSFIASSGVSSTSTPVARRFCGWSPSKALPTAPGSTACTSITSSRWSQP
jgi:hypothetical protein